jgi:hypothetical protein
LLVIPRRYTMKTSLLRTRTEMLFKESEGLPQNTDPPQKNKRKGEATGGKAAPTKRQKTTPKHRTKSKLGKVVTTEVDRAEGEATESPERDTEPAPTAGAKAASGDAAATKVTSPSVDERVRDLERHLSPFFVQSPADELAHAQHFEGPHMVNLSTPSRKSPPVHDRQPTPPETLNQQPTSPA